MKPSTVIAAIVLLAGAGAAGYLLGQRRPVADSAAGMPPAAASATPAAVAMAPASAARRLLYYRNPMGLPDTSPTPKKDPMGMDYLPVYADEVEPATATSAAAAALPAGTLRLSTDKVQKLGVRTAVAALQPLGRTVRAAGRIEPDERRVTVVAPKFEGYVEKLLVNATGQMVVRGQPLFEVYSPELVAAQREYTIAVQGRQAMKDAGADASGGLQQLAESALARLRNWDLPADDVAALATGGPIRRSLTLHSPATGVVTDKKAVQGMRFMAGEPLFQITDLSSVWVVADVAEQDVGLVRLGTRAVVTLAAYPGQTFEGRVGYVYPTLRAETRSVPVRIELANPRLLLKPAMYAQVEFQAGAQAPVLTVPDSAVIETGRRALVLVQRGEGQFEPREVRLGARGSDRIEVLGGLRAGEPVVVSANFLIDAESNLKAAVAAFGAGESR